MTSHERKELRTSLGIEGNHIAADNRPPTRRIVEAEDRVCPATPQLITPDIAVAWPSFPILENLLSPPGFVANEHTEAPTQGTTMDLVKLRDAPLIGTHPTTWRGLEAPE